MHLRSDVVNRVRHDFPAGSGPLLQRLLDLHREDGRLFSDRVLRCIVFAAHGDRDRLEALIELAREDYRDVIVAAEYDLQLNKVRDFEQPFED